MEVFPQSSPKEFGSSLPEPSTEYDIRKIVQDEISKARTMLYHEDIKRGSIKQTHLEALILFRGLAKDLPSDGSTDKELYYEEDTKLLKIWNTVNEAWEIVPVVSSIDSGWSTTNNDPDKTIDANGAVAEIGDGLTTLIDTLIAQGILSA